MDFEINGCVVTVEFVPYLAGTATAPEEGGYFEVTNIEGAYTDDDIPDLEDTAIAMAGDEVDRYLDHLCG
jgi:hypothetical protein